MMKGIGTDGTVFIGLTDEEIGRLLMGEVRVALAAHDGEHVAPAVRIMYAPTYEELRVRLQEHAIQPLPPAIDLRGIINGT
jgi:hypothetical protein